MKKAAALHHKQPLFQSISIKSIKKVDKYIILTVALILSTYFTVLITMRRESPHSYLSNEFCK